MTIPLIERFPRPEQVRNALQTTLSAPIASTARPVTVTPVSSTGFPTAPGFRVIVDSEILLVTYIPSGAATWLAETADGTAAATHSAGAAVTQILTAAGLSQFITDHRGVGSASADPHPMYMRSGSTWLTPGRGLAGDGVTDDTGSLQNEINRLYAAGGGTLWLGPGTYMHSGLMLKHGVWLRGAGMYSTVLKLNPGANRPSITTYPSPDGVAANAEFTGVMDLMIHGNRGSQSSPAAHGILAVPNPVSTSATNDYDWDQHHLFQNLFIRDVAGDGINMLGRGESRMVNVQVYFAQGSGFVLGTDTFLVACTSGQSGKYGFSSNFMGSIRLAGCKAFYAGRLIDTAQGAFPNAGDYAGFYFGGCNGVALVDCEAQDCSREGYFFEQTNRSTMAGCIADSNSHRVVGSWPGFHLYGCSYVTIAGGIAFERRADGSNSYQQNALWLEGGDTKNDITLTHSAIAPATVGPAVTTGSTITSSSVRVNGSDVGLQIPAYAASYTPDPYAGQYVEVTLTGAITVNNPVTPYAGQQLTFVFIQDGTGGRVVTWGSAFKVNWTPTTTAAAKNTIGFVYDGTAWVQISSGIGLP